MSEEENELGSFDSDTQFIINMIENSGFPNKITIGNTMISYYVSESVKEYLKKNTSIKIKCKNCGRKYPEWIFLNPKTKRVAKICERCLILIHPARNYTISDILKCEIKPFEHKNKEVSRRL